MRHGVVATFGHRKARSDGRRQPIRGQGPMVDMFAKVAGPLQAALGVLTAASPQAAAAVGAGAGASGFNVLSGAALSYLGWKGGDANLRTGSQALAGLNLLVGVLGLLGVSQVAG